MGELFACSDASLARHEPITATASQVPAWLLVEVRGAWGRDPVVDSDLGANITPAWRDALRRRGVRPLTIRRDLTLAGGPGVTLVHAVSGRPGDHPSRAWTREIDDLAGVVAATADIVAGRSPGDGWSEAAGPFVLVCTNGRHDSCCATKGRPVMRHLRTSRWAHHVWECSHIGGDRFAANVVLLPDGLYFGRCAPEDAERLLAAHDAGRLDIANFRGRSTFRLVEQAAEHYVRQGLGLDRLDAIAAVARLDERRLLVTAHAGEGLVDVDVVVERRPVPAASPLTCKGHPGLEYPEFRLVTLRAR